MHEQRKLRKFVDLRSGARFEAEVGDIAVTVPLTSGDIALRLVLTLLAGGIIGINRGVHGRAAGLRTTLLVTLRHLSP